MIFRAALLTLALVAGAVPAFADRLKDLASVAGVRSNPLMGYGVVVGLAGSGDGNTGLTLQSLQSLISRLGLVVDALEQGDSELAQQAISDHVLSFRNALINARS